MLKIGEFAKICNVSAQTLRFYDAEGVLCADFVDRESGYRYYEPEKINTYRRITMLKDMGFSLDEIKLILLANGEDNKKRYEEKISELTKQMEALKENIERLRALCGAVPNGIPKENHILFRTEFKDDPKAIGRWILCGQLSCEADLETVSPSCTPTFETIFFLPGGGIYWNFCWTKGVFYRHSSKYNVLLPNEYKIFEKNGETYMTLRWISDECLSDSADSVPLLYKQADNNRYTDEDTRIGVDDVSMPLIPDDEVVGKWDACDIAYDVNNYTLPEKPLDPQNYWIRELRIYDRGLCYKVFGTSKIQLFYTKGAIIDKSERVAEHYFIRRINGDDYLFLEHKSGDYKYKKEILVHYVFKRRKEDKK